MTESQINRTELRKKSSKFYEELIILRDKNKLKNTKKIKETIEKF